MSCAPSGAREMFASVGGIDGSGHHLLRSWLQQQAIGQRHPAEQHHPFMQPPQQQQQQSAQLLRTDPASVNSLITLLSSTASPQLPASSQLPVLAPLAPADCLRTDGPTIQGGCTLQVWHLSTSTYLRVCEALLMLPLLFVQVVFTIALRQPHD